MFSIQHCSVAAICVVGVCENDSTSLRMASHKSRQEPGLFLLQCLGIKFPIAHEKNDALLF